MKKTPIIWTLKKIRNRIPGLILLSVLQICNSLCCVLFALGSRGVIDGAVSRDPELFRVACLKQGAIICGIVLTMVLVRHLRDKLHAQLERDWKRRLLRGLLEGEYVRVREYHSGELINRLNNDVNRLNEGILGIIPNGLSTAARLFAAVVVMGMLDVRFMLLVGCFGVTVLVSAAVFRRKLKDLNKRVSEHDGKISGFIQETLEKLLIVQAMDLSEEVAGRTDRLLDQRYDLHRRRKNASLAANSGIQMLTYGAWFLALCWCGKSLMVGTMSFGAMTAVMQLVGQLQGPLVGLSGILPQYTAATASAERLMELEEIPAEARRTAAAPEELYRRMDAICAENLSFSYDREKVLDGATFEIRKGSFAVIIGASGIGKSTILKLLLGIYPPGNGKICLKTRGGEIPVDRSLRGLFAYVPQGNLLFSGTIRENLTMVKPEATEEEIMQAVHVAAADQFLSEIPGGLDGIIGENGAGLSEGQGQRLAIARAVLGGAPVLLLDECTSALDTETEELVLQRIGNLEDRTCIAVTHRPGARKLADVELMVKNGRVSGCFVDSGM